MFYNLNTRSWHVIMSEVIVYPLQTQSQKSIYSHAYQALFEYSGEGSSLQVWHLSFIGFQMHNNLDMLCIPVFKRD